MALPISAEFARGKARDFTLTGKAMWFHGQQVMDAAFHRCGLLGLTSPFYGPARLILFLGQMWLRLTA